MSTLGTNLERAREVVAKFSGAEGWVEDAVRLVAGALDAAEVRGVVSVKLLRCHQHVGVESFAPVGPECGACCVEIGQREGYAKCLEDVGEVQFPFELEPPPEEGEDEEMAEYRNFKNFHCRRGMAKGRQLIVEALR